jgi:hypothetical protein
MKFFISKDKKVTVFINKVVSGVEIVVFDKSFGASFQINGEEIGKDSILFFKDTTVAEGVEWLKYVGFVPMKNMES